MNRSNPFRFDLRNGIRSNEILVDGFSFPSGIVYALALSLLCMFIGRHRFRNFDLY